MVSKVLALVAVFAFIAAAFNVGMLGRDGMIILGGLLLAVAILASEEID